MKAKVKGKIQKNKILLVCNEPIYARGIEQLIHSVNSPVLHHYLIKHCTTKTKLQSYRFWPSTYLIIAEIDFAGLNMITYLDDKTEDDSKIILIGTIDDKDYIKSKLRKKFTGYWHKRSTGVEAIRCLKHISNLKKKVIVIPQKNERYLRLVKEDNKQKDYIKYLELSNREVEVLKLIARSMTNRDIGKFLFISPQTVNVHRKNLMKKMEVNNSVALIIKAQSLQII